MVNRLMKCVLGSNKIEGISIGDHRYKFVRFEKFTSFSKIAYKAQTPKIIGDGILVKHE